jgi:hypothetical protein
VHPQVCIAGAEVAAGMVMSENCHRRRGRQSRRRRLREDEPGSGRGGQR